MSRFASLVLALACALPCTAYAQQPAPPAAAPSGQSAAPVPPMAPPPEQAKPAAPAASNVPMDEAVITLKGACQTKPGGTPPEGCISSLTREQFEKLTNALQPPEKGPVPPEVRRRFATQYAKLLTFADAARELGLENDPRVQQIFAFARTQILAESLNQHYTEEFSHPTDQQIQEYYNQNVKKYMEVTLQRIIIPMAQAGADKMTKPSDDEQKAYAEKIKQRWVAGEDPTKLEKEAMEHNGVTTSPPDINVGARRPGSLPEAHEVVFEMKGGEITNVFSDPAAFYIYKVVTIRQLPLADVKTQISQTLSRQMFNEKIQAVQSAVTAVLNDAYFGPEPPPSMPGMRPGMPPMPGHGGPPPRPAPPSPPQGAAAPAASSPAPASK